MVTKVANIFAIVEVALAAIIALFALVYSLPILCVRRFHHRNNIFTLNVCLTSIICAAVYGIVFIRPLLGYEFMNFVTHLPWLMVMQTLIGCSVMLSFVLVAFHRCCSIVCHSVRFFRTKRWVMVCLAGEWVLAAIICLPFLVDPKKVRLVSIRASLNIVFVLELRPAMGASLRVRQYVPDTVGDLCGIERADLLSRSCIVTPNTNSDCFSTSSREKHQPSRPAPPAAYDLHVRYLLGWMGTVSYRSHSRVLQANQSHSLWMPMDLV